MLTIAFLLAAALAEPLSFDVASVKVATGQWREPKVGADRIDFPTVSLRYCIAYAYGVKEYQVTGPSWLGEGRYEIMAKGPAGTAREQLPEMMQALLAERFKMAVHREPKEFNVYALVVGKSGPKLKEAAVEPGGPESASFGISMSPARVGRIEVKRGTMIALANTLPRFVGRPVVDLTRLTGRYDFELEFSPEDVSGTVMAPPASAGPATAEVGASIFSSVQRVGLRLDSRKMPLDTIVVDRAERVPVEN